MERFKENLESRKEQNLISSVLMVCFFMMIVSLWAGLSNGRDHETVTIDAEKVSMSEEK